MNFSAFQIDDANLGNVPPAPDWIPPENGGSSGGGRVTILNDPRDVEAPIIPVRRLQPAACNCLTGTAYLDEDNNCRCTSGIETVAPEPKTTVAADFEIDDRTLLIGGAIIAAILLLK